MNDLFTDFYNNAITDKLNDRQKAAVEYIDGALMVIAGAGSGKTRVITHRIAYMISQGVKAYNILAVTFTNKAAGEMRERVQGMVSESVLTCTFHSLAVRMLRQYAEKIGFTKNFIIYDSDDQKTVIKECIKALDLGEDKTNVKVFKNVISNAKNNLKTPAIFADENKETSLADAAKVYSAYQKKLALNDALDFDDLIFMTVKLLKEHEDVREYYQDKFRYIMVDECQDINNSQYAMIKMIADKYKNLCIVGDEDQSIYKFRGASTENLKRFEKDFPKREIIKLEQNYRSTKVILEIANTLVANNQNRQEKNLWTDNPEGQKPAYFLASTQYREADYVVDKIYKYRRDGHSLKDIVIFYRVHALSRVFEDVLRKNNLPYILVGDVSFYNRKEIKDILAYLRVVSGTGDSVALTRIINIPARKIGKKTIEHINTFADGNNISMYEALLHSDKNPLLNARAKNSLVEFAQMIEDFKKEKETKLLSELAKYIIEKIGYEDFLRKDDSMTAQTRIENVQELISALTEYQNEEDASLEGFLEQVSLVADIDDMDENQDRITLMSMHNAKGLEFPVVFIAGMEEGILPHYNAFGDDREIEEERRLCYVGITRAEKILHLTASRKRLLYGADKYNPESRFLEEIPEDKLEVMRESAPGDFFDDEEDFFDDSGSRKKSNSGYLFDQYNGGGGYSSSYSSGYSSSSYKNKYKSKPKPKPRKSVFSDVNEPARRPKGKFNFDIDDFLSGVEPKKTKKNNVVVRKEVKNSSEIEAGNEVLHAKFGTGEVVEVSGEGDMKKYSIKFYGSGETKTLLARLANVKKIG